MLVALLVLVLLCRERLGGASAVRSYALLLPLCARGKSLIVLLAANPREVRPAEAIRQTEDLEELSAR